MSKSNNACLAGVSNNLHITEVHSSTHQARSFVSTSVALQRDSKPSSECEHGWDEHEQSHGCCLRKPPPLAFYACVQGPQWNDGKILV